MLDLRDWLNTLERMNALRTIKGLHWDLEIAVASAAAAGERRLSSGARRAMLFDDITGYPGGYRVLTNSIPSPRASAVCVGVPETDSALELEHAIKRKLPDWEENLGKFRPRVVQTGPVLENVDSGKDVDLFKFPTPKWHELDGGRYIGTGDAVITRDVDREEANIGTYRIQIHDKNTVGLYISPGKHGRLHYENWHAQGKAAPVAISVGQHPIISGIACTYVPSGKEYNFMGAISGEPAEVIKDEITGLPIPAASEIVLVGWCPPDEKRVEGPFGERTGYYASFERPTPIVKVERVYYRNNPIICGSAGIPGLDPALMMDRMEKCGITGIRGVAAGGEFGTGDWLIVSIKQRYAGHARQAALVAAQANPRSAYHTRYVVVVDDDIDPTNAREVLWAIGTRSDPAQDIDVVRRLWSTPLDPTIHKPTKNFTKSMAIIDACRPFEWIDEFPKVISWNPELVERVNKKLQQVEVKV